MKFGKPGKGAAKVAVTGAGVIAGAKGSKAVSSVVPMDNKTTKQLVVGAAGVALAAFTKGEDHAANFVRGAGIGMAAQQFGDALDGAVADKLPDNKAIKAAFGQSTTSVAASQKALAAYRRRKSMGNPTMALGNGMPETVVSSGNVVLG